MSVFVTPLKDLCINFLGKHIDVIPEGTLRLLHPIIDEAETDEIVIQNRRYAIDRVKCRVFQVQLFVREPSERLITSVFDKKQRLMTFTQGSGLTPSVLTALFRSTPEVDMIELSDYIALDTVLISSIIESCPNIRHLNLIRCGKISDAEVDLICRELPNLVSLSLKGCFQISNRCCELIGQNLIELKSLDLSSCQYVTDEGIFAVAQCVNLERIGLAFLTEITEKGIERLVNDCSFLNSIDLTHCSRLGSNAIAMISDQVALLVTLSIARTNFIPKAISEVAEKCRLLEQLDLAHCDVDDEVIFKLSQYCRDLTSLNLRRCTKISHTALQALLPGCSKLTFLCVDSVPSINEECLGNLATYCPDLTYLDISFCRSIKDVTALPPIIQRLQRLKELRAFGLDLSPNILQNFKRCSPLLRIVFIPNK